MDVGKDAERRKTRKEKKRRRMKKKRIGRKRRRQESVDMHAIGSLLARSSCTE